MGVREGGGFAVLIGNEKELQINLYHDGYSFIVAEVLLNMYIFRK